MNSSAPNQLDICCPACRGKLIKQTDMTICATCGVTFPSIQGIPCLFSKEEREAVLRDLKSDGENAFKNWFKRYPQFYVWVVHTCTPILFNGLTVKKFLTRFPSGAGLRILNVGSGPTRTHADVINLDIYPFPNVDVIATATRLPFADATFDVVVTEEVIEHVADPFGMARELMRVAKPGGLVFLGGPFTYPLHGSPRDYTRWTYDGLLATLPSAIEVERGIIAGPTSGVLSMLAMWFAIVCSFGVRPLRKTFHYVFMILLSPLKLADLLLIHFPGAHEIAHALYVIVRKPTTHDQN